MKNLLLLGILLFSLSVKAQLLDKLKNKAKQAESEILNDKQKKKDKAPVATTPKADPPPSDNTTPAQNPISEPAKTSLATYGKYDFVPGTQVIFEDKVENEQLGEFPSKWDLGNGQIEVAELNGEQVIAFLEGNYASITPLMKEMTKDYLPDVFSLEFDFFSNENTQMSVGFYNNKQNPEGLGDLYGWIKTGKNAEIAAASGNYPEEDFEKKWHHIALSYNLGNVKIYTDQFRLAILPHAAGNPVGISFGCIGSRDNPTYIKNIRIAKGGGDLYKRIMTDGKFITRGILFAVGKAEITPLSMGSLNEIATLLKAHPELKFEIGGHTDSDGDPAANLKLSDARAAAIKNQLVSMGIASERLTTKGYGASKPIAPNDSPEGKANNRRVEFVKK